MIPICIVIRSLLKIKAYDKEFKTANNPKVVAKSRKTAKFMLGQFKTFSSSSSEITKIFKLNKRLNAPFESNSEKLFMDLDRKMKRSLIMYVNSMTAEFLAPGSPEESKYIETKLNEHFSTV